MFYKLLWYGNVLQKLLRVGLEQIEFTPVERQFVSKKQEDTEFLTQC